MSNLCPAIKKYFATVTKTISKLNIEEINIAINAIAEAIANNATIYVLGNGGSAATASHFVCDFNKGASKILGKSLNFVCLSDNTPIITAIANDIGYDDIFSFQLMGKLNSGDLIIAISGSGNSKNVIKAVEYAKQCGNKVVGITGFDGGKLKQMSDFYMHVSIDDMQVAEDIHIMFNHMMLKVLTSKV